MANTNIIRMTADIGPLADEFMASMKIPTDATYCDPDIGGGQIAARFEARLRARGESDAYIRSHVFGFSTNAFDLAYAKARWNLVGTYAVASLEEIKKMGKKFDVVVINPPYQDGSKGDAVRKNKGKLWFKFFELTKQLIKSDGYVGFISPTSWMSPSKESFVKTKILTTLTTDLDLQVAMFGLTQKHFRGVGADIGVIVYQNRPYQGATKIGNDTFDLSGMFFIPKSTEAMDIRIMRKIVAKKGPRFTFKGLSSYSDKGVNLNKTGGKYAWLPSLIKAPIEYSDTKPPKNAYYGVPKIHYTRQTGGRHPTFTIDMVGEYAIRHDGHIHKMDTSGISYRVLTDIFNHKLVKFMLRNQWTEYVETQIASLIPITDQDLYTYFGLTKAEVNYIEEQVK